MTSLMIAAIMSVCMDSERCQVVRGSNPKFHMMPIRESHFQTLVGGLATGPPDTAKCRTVSRWPKVIYDMSRGTNQQLVLDQIKAYNPNQRMVAYISGTTMFCCGAYWWWEKPPIGGCDTSHFNIPWVREKVVRKHNAILYSLTRDYDNDGKKDAFSFVECSGGGFCPPPTHAPNINWAMPNVANEMADSVLAIFNSSPGRWNELMIDEICLDESWIQGAGDSVDYTRSGHADFNAWVAAQTAGMTAFFDRLKAGLPAGFKVTGNCGALGPRTINGWLRENFPSQNGSPPSWETNMFGHQDIPADVGYFGDDAAYTSPQATYMSIWRENDGQLPDTTKHQDDPENLRKHRFGLASAALTNAASTCITGDDARVDLASGYIDWWPDEASVDPNGNSTPRDSTYSGWLGAPLVPAYRVGDGWRRDYQGGVVLVNPKTSGSCTFPVSAGKVANKVKYYRIRGVIDPVVNNGQRVNSVTLPPSSGLFLIKRRVLGP